MLRIVRGKIKLVKYLLSNHISSSQLHPLNPVHIFTFYFFRMIVNVAFPSTSSSPKLYLSLMFSDYSPVCMFYVWK
jgi:hypothetical protein